MILKKSVLIIWMFLFFSFEIIPGVFAQNTEIGIQNLKLLTNPELHNETDIRNFTRQNIEFLAKHTVDSPFQDSAQNRLLKQEAGFFIKFISRNVTDDIYQAIGDKIYIRMPRGMDPPLRDSLLGRITASYTQSIKQWQKLGLREPKGFIFIWVISGIDEMRLSFDINVQVEAFALPCRYIVIPYNVISDRMQSEFERKAFVNESDPAAFRNFIDKVLTKSFKTNLAHELTHVLVSSSIGYPQIDYMGKWFHEGTAIWMSGNNEGNLTNEYQDYKHLFDFIRMKYGNQRFLRFIKGSITGKSALKSLRNNLQIHDENELKAASGRWFAEIKRVEVGLSVILIFLAGFAVFRWVQTKPSYLFFGGYFSLWILYCWRYGFLNFWAGSALESAVLYAGAVFLLGFIATVIARQIYYSCIISKEIKSAQDRLEMALAARAHLLLPLEFERVSLIIERSIVYMQQWKNREGLREARIAMSSAEGLIAAVSLERKRRRAQRVYSKCRRLLAEMEIKKNERAASNDDTVLTDIGLESLERTLDQMSFQMKGSQFSEAYETGRNLIKTAKKITKTLPG